MNDSGRDTVWLAIEGEMVTGEWDEWAAFESVGYRGGRDEGEGAVGGGGSSLGVASEEERDAGWRLAFTREEAERWTGLLERALVAKRDQEWAGIHLGRFVRSIGRRRLDEAVAEDVRRFLRRIIEFGAADWQVKQAERAVRVALKQVLALKWTENWPAFAREALTEAGGVGGRAVVVVSDEERMMEMRRRRAAGDGAEALVGAIVKNGTEIALPEAGGPGEVGSVRAAGMARFDGRLDEGELPQRYRPFLEELRIALRKLHYAARTEETYVDWTRRFLVFVRPIGRDLLKADDVALFLEYLAVVRTVGAATQNQALNALVFVFREVLDRDLGEIGAVERAKQKRRLPVVLSREEVRRLIEGANPPYALMIRLMYGTGMRLMECVRLRVKDVDFDHRQVVVRSGKGDKDRVTTLPDSLVGPLHEHLSGVRETHEADLVAGHGSVFLPDALQRKWPNAAKEWAWQYVFPAGRLTVEGPVVRRHHVHENSLQKAVKEAATRAGLTKRRV